MVRLLRKLSVVFLILIALFSVFNPLFVHDNTMSMHVNEQEETSIFPIYKTSPFEQDNDSSLQGPSTDHILGTDILGRDIFARLIFGTKYSFFIGLIATFISLLIGIPIGSIAGYKGGHFDYVFSRFFEMFYSLPVFFILIIVSALVTGNIYVLALCLGLLGWIIPARYIRGEIMKIKNEEYVLYARAAGASDFYIIRKHLIPNAISPVLVSASFSMASMIMVEASLSFLGLGVQPPNPSWGGMIQEGLNYIGVAPWIYIPPSVLIFFSIISYDTLGEIIKEKLHND